MDSDRNGLAMVLGIVAAIMVGAVSWILFTHVQAGLGPPPATPASSAAEPLACDCRCKCEVEVYEVPPLSERPSP